MKTLKEKQEFVNKSYDFSFKNSKPYYSEEDVKEFIKDIDKFARSKIYEMKILDKNLNVQLIGLIDVKRFLEYLKNKSGFEE